VRAGYVAVGLVFVAIGLLMVAFPRPLGQFRNRGAVDPEPTQALEDQIRYIGGPLLTGLGSLLTWLAVTGA